MDDSVVADGPADWIWETPSDPFCLQPASRSKLSSSTTNNNNDNNSIRQLDTVEQAIACSMISVSRQIEAEWQSFFSSGVLNVSLPYSIKMGERGGCDWEV